MRGRLVFLFSLLFAGTLAAADLDALTMRWTFGAHEPLAMYRRNGRRTTGGIEGSAHWTAQWLDWFDTKSPELMKELGLNWCHARFYKGMGWQTEKEDLPQVKRFVDACHRNGVSVLAYMQFSTLYYETLEEEIPNLEDWACVDETGRKRTYFGDAYYRWRTCPTCREWEEYIKPILAIAVTKGGYDGVMFDNAFSEPCYCSRCLELFRKHLSGLPDLKDRFGFTNMRHVRFPSEAAVKDEIKDPLVQEWLFWRAQVMCDLFTRLRLYVKSVKADAVFAANPQPLRRADSWRTFSVDMSRFAQILDLVIAQSGNYPAYDAGKDIIRSRIRDLKLFQAMGKTAVALCDSDSALTEAQERFYLLPLIEDMVFGGVPTDRTVVSPVAEKGFVSAERVNRRRPLLRSLNQFVEKNRVLMKAPAWCPIRLLYAPTAVMLSETCNRGLTAAEEILIRRHLPFGYLPSTADGFEVPSDCEVIVVPDQICLSSRQIDALVAWAEKGGKVVVTGDSGRCDELNRQRFSNPLRERLSKCPTVVWRELADRLTGAAELGWSYRIPAPQDGGDALVSDLSSVGFRLPYVLSGVPRWVAVEVKRTSDGYALQFVNYRPAETMRNVEVEAPGFRVIRVSPFDGSGDPRQYMLVELKKGIEE